MSDDQQPGTQPAEPRADAQADVPSEAQETVNRESHPSSGGPAGLSGDMGLSSERHGPFPGIEGTGSQASAQTATDGETGTVYPDPDPEGATSLDLDKPDETSPVTHVDRTVGEVQPDPVASKHEFDPSRNPRH